MNLQFGYVGQIVENRQRRVAYVQNFLNETGTHSADTYAEHEPDSY
jgi:hypothetical protein